MTGRETAAVAIWAVFVVGALGLGVAASPIWFAVAGLALVGLLGWVRQFRS